MKKADWYFDFISPFAYLQFARFGEFAGKLDIAIKPVVFGVLLKHWGQLGPAEIPGKRRFVYRFFKWQADKIGAPFVMPPSHPFNPLPALRLCMTQGATPEVTGKIWNMIFGEGAQPDTPEGITAIAEALGLDEPDAAITNEAAKAALRQNTDEAIAADVFGVPTFVIDGQLFWGEDATEMILDYVENPELFESSEMKQISEMPMGVVRK